MTVPNECMRVSVIQINIYCMGYEAYLLQMGATVGITEVCVCACVDKFP